MGTEGQLERIAASLERLVAVVEAILLPNARSSPYGGPDTSTVTYIDDKEQAFIEARQEAYWRKTGRRLEAWEAPPRPVDDDGREWTTLPASRDEDPPTGA